MADFQFFVGLDFNGLRIGRKCRVHNFDPVFSRGNRQLVKGGEAPWRFPSTYTSPHGVMANWMIAFGTEGVGCGWTVWSGIGVFR